MSMSFFFLFQYFQDLCWAFSLIIICLEVTELTILISSLFQQTSVYRFWISKQLSVDTMWDSNLPCGSVLTQECSCDLLTFISHLNMVPFSLILLHVSMECIVFGKVENAL